MKNKVIVINLFGGPGAGKSTQRAEIFSKLKKLGYNVEEVREYAKKLTWKKSYKMLQNQLYVFAKQHNEVWQLQDEVQVVITDSPILLSVLYGRYYKSMDNPYFESMALYEFERNTNLNVYLERPTHYQKEGRNQTEKEARDVDNLLQKMMEEFGYTYDMRLSVDDGNVADLVVERVVKMIEESKTEEVCK
jgi:nicotinamide riboside kinase